MTNASQHNADELIESRWKYAAVISERGGWGVVSGKLRWGGMEPKCDPENTQRSSLRMHSHTA